MMPDEWVRVDEIDLLFSVCIRNDRSVETIQLQQDLYDSSEKIVYNNFESTSPGCSWYIEAIMDLYKC